MNNIIQHFINPEAILKNPMNVFPTIKLKKIIKKIKNKSETKIQFK
jgi:hypothetical protein